MFVVDFTAAGFPIGIREEDDRSWLEEDPTSGGPAIELSAASTRV